MDGSSILHAAAYGYNVEVVRWFLNKGIDPDIKGPYLQGTPLLHAIGWGTTRWFSELNSTTPELESFAKERRLETIRILFDADSNPEAPCQELNQHERRVAVTPLQRAKRLKKDKALSILKKYLKE